MTAYPLPSGPTAPTTSERWQPPRVASHASAGRTSRRSSTRARHTTTRDPAWAATTTAAIPIVRSGRGAMSPTRARASAGSTALSGSHQMSLATRPRRLCPARPAHDTHRRRRRRRRRRRHPGRRRRHRPHRQSPHRRRRRRRRPHSRRHPRRRPGNAQASALASVQLDARSCISRRSAA